MDKGKIKEWQLATDKAHKLQIWKDRSVEGEWPLIQHAANRILEAGVRREWELQEERTRRRRQALKQKFLSERRADEELRIKMKEFGMI